MNTGTAHERDEIESLLPWHATGTLSHREARRVDAALARDPALVRRLAAIREEIAETIHIHEMLDVPSSRISNRLFAVVDADAPKAARSSISLGARLAGLFGSFQLRTLAWASTAGLALIVAQSGLIATMFFADQYGQGRLQGPDSYRSIEIEPRTQLLVRFRSNASANDIVGFLGRNNATLIDGPHEGRFRVRVANVTSGQDLSEAMRRMQAETSIVESVSAVR
jgi:hypothetical protein